jgi:hypothetical protein
LIRKDDEAKASPHVSLNYRTKESLDSIRVLGQSYDGIMHELITLLKNNSRKQVKTGREKI